MKKAVLIMLLALTVWAADFWQSKPYATWSDKEVQKILVNSPWAKQYSTSTQSGFGDEAQSGSRRRGGDPNPGEISNPSAGPATGNDPGGLGRYNASTGDPAAARGGGPPALVLVIRWQSSLAVREAIAKAKYGSETATSPEAKKYVETPIDHYVISVSGIPRARFSASGDELKKMMLDKCALEIKGREPIRADDFKLEDSPRATEVLFAFPKSAAITEQDKEVEFTLKLGDLSIRQKFRLKDMLIDGKLEL